MAESLNARREIDAVTGNQATFLTRRKVDYLGA